MISLGLCGLVMQGSLAAELPSNTIFASGNQVRVINQDGVMYLSTEVDATKSATPSASTHTRFSVMGTLIDVPTGFASDIGTYISAVLRLVMLVAALLVFLYLIMGGIQWITSGGDKGKVDQARQKLIAAVIGIIILASSYAVLLLALNFLGFSSLNEVFDSMIDISGQEIVTPTTPPSPSPTPSPESLGEIN